MGVNSIDINKENKSNYQINQSLDNEEVRELLDLDFHLGLEKINEVNEEDETESNDNEKRRQVENGKKESWSIYDLRRKERAIKQGWIRMNVVVVNMQCINKEEKERRKKIKFLRDLIDECNAEIIFIIDVANIVEDFNVANYVNYKDGRNILLVKLGIKNEVKRERGVFKVRGADLNFAYVRPNETDEVKEEVKKLLRENKAVFGDLNLKSNKDLLSEAEDKLIVGEKTMQIVYVKKNDKSVDYWIKMCLSDHKVAIFSLRRRMIYTLDVRLKKIERSKTKEAIENIFEKGKLMVDTKLVQVKKVEHKDEEDFVRDKIVNAFLEGDVKKVFNKFDYLWRKKKKEPFLGVTVPKGVEESLRLHYRDNINKEYKKVDTNVDLKQVVLWPKNKSYSHALMEEGVVIKDVDESLYEVWKQIVEEGKTNEAIKKFLSAYNENVENQAYVTFFLIKKPKLESVNDVRIISIVPIFLKIWESLIYDEIISYMTQEIDELQKYQFGGRSGGSTYETFYYCQKRYKEQKGKALLYIDLEKGYDSINWEILEKDIASIGSPVVKSMLLIWLTMVKNTDAMVNGSKVKKTRGLGMGLALAPIIFVWYVDKGLRVHFQELKDIIVMYVDDLTIVIRKPEDVELFKMIKEDLLKRDLKINNEKCTLVSNDNGIRDNFEKLGINCVDQEKYLGVVLRINADNELICDERIYKFNKEYASLPRMIIFAIRKVVINGAIYARLRYSAMMKSIGKKIERGQLWKLLWMQFRSNRPMLSYAELILFGMNVFKFCIDLYDLEKFKEKWSVVKDEINGEVELQRMVKEKLETGVEQVDKVIERMEIKIDWNRVKVNLESLKEVTNSLWEELKEKDIDIWLEEHENIWIRQHLKKITNSILFRNSQLVQSIVFRHYKDVEIEKKMLIIMVVEQILEEEVNKEKDKFEVRNMIWLAKEYRKKDKLVRWMHEYYDNRLFEDIKKANETNIKKQKELLNVLLYIEQLFGNKVWNNHTIEDWVYVLNLKKELKEDRIEEIGEKIIQIETQDDITIEDEKKLEGLNVISVDGSYNKESKKGNAAVILTNEIGNKELWEKWFVKVRGYDEIKNPENLMELAGVIKGLELAGKKGWKDVYVVSDYIGSYNYIFGQWSASGSKVVKWYRKNFWKVVSQNKMKVKFYKVKGHSGIEINEEADRIARNGEELVVEAKVKQEIIDVRNAND